MRSVVVRFGLAPGSPPAVTEQRRSHCADVPALPDTPTRAQVAAVFSAFTGGTLGPARQAMLPALTPPIRKGRCNRRSTDPATRIARRRLR